MSTLFIDNIKCEDRQRHIDEAHAIELSNSIKNIGLISPIVIDRNNRLLAGGHRLRALQLLNKCLLKEGEHYIYSDAISEDQKQEIELEENIRRKDLTWQEKAIAIFKIHKLKEIDAILDKREWGQALTGELLGMSQANVSYCLKVVTYLLNNDQEIINCDSLGSAIKLLLFRKEREAMVKLVEFNKSSQNQQKSSVSITSLSEPEEQKPCSYENIADKIIQNIYNLDCIPWMLSSVNANICDHIITDPPYGIDLSNFNQKEGYENLSLNILENTHDKESNLRMFEPMLRGFYNCLKDDGYALVWCDPEHWSKLCDKASEVGFSVQRWPLVWCKTHTCINQSAFCNFTKTVEFVAVLRKGNPTLVTPQSKNFYMAARNPDDKYLDHAFVKPFTVWSWLYNAVAINGQTVLDPFSGVGSSTLAALQLKLNPIAIEVEPEFYRNQIKNINDYYKKLCSP